MRIHLKTFIVYLTVKNNSGEGKLTDSEQFMSDRK